MRISTFTRLVEDKIIAAAKASAPHAKRAALSTQRYAAKAAYASADACIKVAARLDTKKEA